MQRLGHRSFKIADFGRSRGGDGGIKRGAGDEASPGSYYQSSNSVFPMRWTAPDLNQATTDNGSIQLGVLVRLDETLVIPLLIEVK